MCLFCFVGHGLFEKKTNKHFCCRCSDKRLFDLQALLGKLSQQFIFLKTFCAAFGQADMLVFSECVFYKSMNLWQTLFIHVSSFYLQQACMASCFQLW